MEDISILVVVLLVSVTIALLIFKLFRKSLKSLLDEVVSISSGTIFYVRVFLISLVFIALSSALKIQFQEDAKFMEYVWEIADGLSSVFSGLSIFLVVYLTLITILISVLRHKSD